MRVSEAIKILKRDLQIQKDNKALPDGIESLEIAIKSLEEFKDLKEKETENLLKDGQFLYQQGLVDGYAKAIDEFAERMKKESFSGYATLEDYCEDTVECVAVEDIDKIAEEMRGAKNEKD